MLLFMYQTQPPPPNIVNRLPDLVLMEVDEVPIAVAVLLRRLESMNERKNFHHDRCVNLRNIKRALANDRDWATDPIQILKLENKLKSVEEELRFHESNLYAVEQEISNLRNKIDDEQILREFEISLTLRFQTYSYLLQEGKQIDIQLIKGQFYIDLNGANMPLNRMRDEEYLKNERITVVQSGKHYSPGWNFQGRGNCDTLYGRFGKTVLGDLDAGSIEKVHLKYGFRVQDYLTDIKILNVSAFTSKTDRNSIVGVENELKDFVKEIFKSDLSFMERSI